MTSACWRAPAVQQTSTAVPLDLAHDLEAALDGAVDLVTTSALLDLVSEAWLDRFAVEAAARRLPVYAALSYDGRTEFDPADPLDEKIVAAVNAHQRTDKGFGPALGPAAARAAIERFEQLGYSVVQGTSDWMFAPSDREIQIEALAGWAAAAREIGDPQLADVLGWLTRRRELVGTPAGQRSASVTSISLRCRAPRAERDRSQSNSTSSSSRCTRTGVAQRLIGALDRRQREARCGRSRG